MHFHERCFFFCVPAVGDNNWHRAVVLEISKEEIRVLYADYGNTEKLPFSWIAAIPKNLLELPFRIIRCALVGEDTHSRVSTHVCSCWFFHSFSLFPGQEHFPAEWPEEVLLTFKSLLSEGVVASALCFDGFANVLSLNQASGGSVSDAILAVLQAQPGDKPTPHQACDASSVGWLSHFF